MSNEANQGIQSKESTKLLRVLGLKEGITMTTGMIVGVGLFTVGTNGVGMLGGMIVVSTFIAFLICLWPAQLYGEMGTMFPLAGGTYNFAQKGVNKLVANIAGWNYAIAIIGAVGASALAFSTYLDFLLLGFGVELNVDPRVFATILCIIFIAFNYVGIGLAAKMQNAMIFFFWGCTIIWFFTVTPEISLANFFKENSASWPGFGVFVQITGLIWWCFAGFEMVAGLAGEIKYPRITIPRILLISPFIVFAITAIFQWYITGLVPPTAANYEMLMVSEAPYAEGLVSVGILGTRLIILCVGIAFGGVIALMNPGISGTARYIYQMGDEGVLPKFFSKVHPKYHTPHISVLFVGLVALALVMTNSLVFIASLSLFSILACYIIGFCSYIGLRIRFPEIDRPYKAPGGLAGAVISIILYAVLMSQIGIEALYTGIGFSVFATLFYLVKTRIFKGEIYEAAIDTYTLPDMDIEPPADEKKKMDRSFKIWLSGAVAVASIAILLYVFAYIS